MTREESLMIERLLSAESTEAEVQKVIKWMGEYFEEDYILDLARSKGCLNALKSFSSSKEVRASAALKKKAKALFQKYS